MSGFRAPFALIHVIPTRLTGGDHSLYQLGIIVIYRLRFVFMGGLGAPLALVHVVPARLTRGRYRLQELLVFVIHRLHRHRIGAGILFPAQLRYGRVGLFLGARAVRRRPVVADIGHGHRICMLVFRVPVARKRHFHRRMIVVPIPFGLIPPQMPGHIVGVQRVDIRVLDGFVAPFIVLTERPLALTTEIALHMPPVHAGGGRLIRHMCQAVPRPQGRFRQRASAERQVLPVAVKAGIDHIIDIIPILHAGGGAFPEHRIRSAHDLFKEASLALLYAFDVQQYGGPIRVVLVPLAKNGDVEPVGAAARHESKQQPQRQKPHKPFLFDSRFFHDVPSSPVDSA